MPETLADGRANHLIPSAVEDVLENREIGTHRLLGADVAARINSEGEVPVRMASLRLLELHISKNQIVGDFINIVDGGAT